MPDEFKSATITGTLPTIQELRSLLDEIVGVEQRLTELDEQLKAFGV